MEHLGNEGNVRPRISHYEDELWHELSRFNSDARLYVFELNARYEQNPLYKKLEDIKKEIVIDTMGTSLPSTHPDGASFRGGALIGMSVAEKALPPHSWEQLAAACAAVRTNSGSTFTELDQTYQRRNAREAMIQQAGRGLGRGEVYGSFVMQIAHRLFPQNLASFQYGFGFVIYNTDRLLADHDMLAQEAISYFDAEHTETAWNSTIAALLMKSDGENEGHSL